MCFPFSPGKGETHKQFDPHPFLGQSREVVYVYWFGSPPTKHERFPPLPFHTLIPPSSPGLARSSPGPRPVLARSSPGPRPALAWPSAGPRPPSFLKQSSRQNGQREIYYTVSRVLFRRRELTEFYSKLGEFGDKLGEFAFPHK